MGALTSPHVFAHPPPGRASRDAAPWPRQPSAPPLLAPAGACRGAGGVRPRDRRSRAGTGSSPRPAFSSPGRARPWPPGSGSCGGSRSGPTAWRATGRRRPGSRRDCSTAPTGPRASSSQRETERSAHVLRHSFRLAAAPAQARMYATAHGVYETYLNGRRVGDVELAPGYTSYPTTLHVQVYDVGALLGAGDNTWEVVLSDGWWRGRTGFFQGTDGFGSTLAFLGQLHADDEVIATGPEWESATGPPGQRRPHGGAGGGPPERRRCLAGRLRRRGRLRGAGLFAGAAHPPGGGAPPGRRDPSRARSPGRRPRAEHQRLAAAARPWSRRHRADDRARRGPRTVGRRHPGPPEARLVRRHEKSA